MLLTPSSVLLVPDNKPDDDTDIGDNDNDNDGIDVCDKDYDDSIGVSFLLWGFFLICCLIDVVVLSFPKENHYDKNYC